MSRGLNKVMIIGGLAVVLYGIFDFVRSYTYLVMSRGIVQKMNLPALQASVRKALEGGVNEGSQALREDLQSVQARTEVLETRSEELSLQVKELQKSSSKFQNFLDGLRNLLLSEETQ